MYHNIESLQKAIVELCSNRGITINKLASMSGLTQSTIDSILKGKSKNPKIATLQKLAKGLNLDFEEFLLHIDNIEDRDTTGNKFQVIGGKFYEKTYGGDLNYVEHEYKINIDILARVKKLRLDKNISLFSFCKDTGFDRLFETHYYAIPPDTLIKLCTYFDTSADYLLGLSEDSKRH